LSVVVSSVVIERLVDGVWLIGGFYLMGYFVSLPGILVGASQILLALLAALAVLMTLAMLYHGHARAAVSQSRFRHVLLHVVDGVHSMGRSWAFAGVVVLSLVYLLLQVVPIWALMRAYGLNLSPWAAAVVLVILRLGTVIPQGPGNVGSFQALVVLGLGILGTDRDTATGYATLLFLVITVPLWLSGFVALLATKMKLEEIHREAHEHLESSRSSR
jgi:uncharacterized membrane protein YbhN (UPF0104 family)